MTSERKSTKINVYDYNFIIISTTAIENSNTVDVQCIFTDPIFLKSYKVVHMSLP